MSTIAWPAAKPNNSSQPTKHARYNVSMLRITLSVNAAAAKRYFTASLSEGDYYRGDAPEPGLWGGEGAKRLGLSGEVEREPFSRLAENELPDGSGQLTARTKLNRRAGYDVNFHCPKSVSVMHAFNGDERILAAFNQAVDDTMRHMEVDTRTRVRTDGQQGDRPSPNLIWAKFVHHTSRPVQGIPDPHLHAHCFTFNATFDPVEQRWKAVELGEVKRKAPFYEAYFHSRLAQYLTEAGYEVERRSRYWELAQVPESVIAKFSRRTEQIERVAAERGITDPEQKAELGARTRRSKSEAKPWDEVWRDWNSRLSDDDRGCFARPEPSPESPLSGRSIPSLDRLGADRFGQGRRRPERKVPSSNERAALAREALDYGLGVTLERASVTRDERVLEHAMRYSVGKASYEDIRAEFGRLDVIRRDINGCNYLTTAAVLAEERAMLDFARNGRGTCRPFVADPHAPEHLSGSQARAYEYVLSSRDSVTLVRGAAGTGKTTLMEAVIPEIEKQGTRVRVFAVRSSTAREVLRGRGFEDAETVARFLSSKDVRETVSGGVIWVDEAGQLGTRTLGEVFQASEELGARVVLSGDFRQHTAVERGDALRLLETQGGLRSAEIREIRRQRAEYREAIELLSRGETAAGFTKLDELEAFREIEDDVTRYATVAREYSMWTRLGKSAIVISPTRAERDHVTGVIREELKQKGQLGQEHEFLQLRDLQLTEAERAFAGNYKVGQVVQFHAHAGTFRAGSRAKVVAVDEQQNVVAAYDGQIDARPLPLHRAKAFSVYEPGTIKVAEGETIRITRNGRAANNSRLSSGTRYTVAGFDERGFVLNDGRVVDMDYGHIEHGYCTTSHASQGSSAERVFLVQSMASMRAASQEQFYVSASRGIEGVSVYTDNKVELLRSVSYSSQRTAALEMVKPQVADLWMARASEQVVDMSSKVMDATLDK